MNWLEAVILGILQGLTEFLPISSSGHLELGKVLLGVETEHTLLFTVVVHGATVLSIIIVFFRDIRRLARGLFRRGSNEETRFLARIGVSIIPVAAVGFFWSSQVESLFTGRVLLVGLMLLVTGTLLWAAAVRSGGDKEISLLHGLLIGIAQAVAVVPGISRSGATISTGLILGNRPREVARFSFLMVLVPIIGANARDLLTAGPVTGSSVGSLPLFLGFLAALISGLLACRWMLRLVQKGKLWFFSVYCGLLGGAAIVLGL